MEVRQRRIAPLTSTEPKVNVSRSASGTDEKWPAGAAFLLLLGARLVSVTFNVIHDCDEVFNYWEPLHYMLYGSGMQTWEYSAEFALRPYIYLLLHAIVGLPASLLFGAGVGKRCVFYAVRTALAVVSAYTEARLCRATQQVAGTRVANYLLCFLCISSGMFCASTALLPSSFTMYAMTAAAAAVLEGKPLACEAYSAVGILWGWVVAGVAYIPYALYVLLTCPLLSSILTALAALILTLLPLLLLDTSMYGRMTVSLWNFLQYNVVGGGDSALYGVEDWSFYLRNGVNNLNIILPLALAAPLALLLSLALPASGSGCTQRNPSRLLVAISPVFAWLAAITALPHKEERFLYVVYPLMCLSGAWTLHLLLDSLQYVLHALLRLPPRLAGSVCGLAGALCVGLVGLLSVSRSAALVINYGAPLQVFTRLPQASESSSPIYVCSGTEWYRFPSSFFLPGQRYRLQFIQSDVTNLLPHQFDPHQGGSAASPPYFNDRNQGDSRNYWNHTAHCHYLVSFNPQHYEPLYDATQWEELYCQPFVDASKSPSISRALYIPSVSAKHNVAYPYCLLRNLQVAHDAAA